MNGVHPDLPILRDPDGYTYFKEEVGGLVIGGFEPEAKPWLAPDRLPYPFEFQLLDEDWDHFPSSWRGAGADPRRPPHRDPEVLQRSRELHPGQPVHHRRGSRVRNLFVGAGFNSVGIASAGGAGRALAEWIVEGEPTVDLVAQDIRRFAPFNGNNQWLHDRVGEILGLHYEIPWPNRELVTARPFRRSPVHHLLAAKGRVRFEDGMGAGQRVRAARPARRLEYSWDRPEWLGLGGRRAGGHPRAVAVFDETSFGKLGRRPGRRDGAPAPVHGGRGRGWPGRLHGHAQRRGGYEADVTVTRLAHDRYLLVTGSASVVRDRSWIERHSGPTSTSAVVDVSSSYAVYGVMGPASGSCSATRSGDLSDAAFPFATGREIDLGRATVWATRITYVGELGWELYVPTEFAVGVYEHLVRPEPTSLSAAGYYAINSLRLDKGYRAFGSDLAPITPRWRPDCGSPASWRHRSTSSVGPPWRRP